jgi:hypothetical protein
MNPRYDGKVFRVPKASFAALICAATLAMTSAPARACTPRTRDARVHVSFLADSDLAAMVKWARDQTCIDYVFDQSMSGRRLTQGVILTVVGSDLGAAFELLLHTMNLRLKGTGTRRAIVSMGPESVQSKAARDREKIDSERERIFANLGTEISKTDGSHYILTRKGLEAVLGNISALSRSMRIAPEVKNGKPNGFRVSSIKPGSLLALVGFQNGDSIQAVNGNEISTPEKALETYTKLRSTGLVRASILREGKPVTIEIKIE